MSHPTPNNDDGTVLVSRPGVPVEQRKIHVRYGGRSLVTLLLLAATVVLTIISKYEWALLASALTTIWMGQTALRFQNDLKWVTGYSDKNKS